MRTSSAAWVACWAKTGRRRRAETLLLLDGIGTETSTPMGWHSLPRSSTLSHLMECLCYFVTHFPIVTDSGAYPDRVASGHGVRRRQAGASCFCLSFVGVQPESYGINVARLAGVDPRVLRWRRKRRPRPRRRTRSRATRGRLGCPLERERGRGEKGEGEGEREREREKYKEVSVFKCLEDINVYHGDIVVCRTL